MKVLKSLLKKDQIVDVKDVEIESKNRLDELAPAIKRVVAIIAVVWTLFQIYTTKRMIRVTGFRQLELR